MIVYFKDAVTKKQIELGPYGKSGMDVSPLDIPLKGDFIKDDFDRYWEVIAREHYWTGHTHYITLHFKQL